MQTTSDVYKDLLRRGAAKEVRVEIGGEIYGEDRLVELTTSGGLFSSNTMCVGSAVAGQVDLSVVDYGDIPRMAKIVPSYRLVLGDEVSEWVQKGVYYIDTRQLDKTSGVLTIHGYDDMLKSSVVWEPDQSLIFPMTRRSAALSIAESMGVEIENPEDIDDTQAIVDYPANDYTQRNVLQFIAASHAANFVMTDLGKLRMIAINEMPEESGNLVDESGRAIVIGGLLISVSDVEINNVSGTGSKVFVGQNVSSSGSSPAFPAVSKIVLLVDDENAWIAGDDDGTALEVRCPYGSQAMADELLEKVRGFVYRPFSAEDSIVDPSTELGDGITVDGVYTVLARQDITFDGLMLFRVSAPGEYEVESEYPYQTREMLLDYKLAQTRSSIEKTANEIRLEVSGKIGEDDASALIQTALEGIELSISNSEGTTTFELTGGGATLTSKSFDLHVDAVNIHGKLTADQIETDELKVDAANITGSLTIGQLPDGVATTDDIPDVSDFVTESGVTTIIDGHITTDYINALGITATSVSASNITAGTMVASRLKLNGLLEVINGNATGYVGANNVRGGVVIADNSASVYCIATNDAAKMSYKEEKMIWVATGGCYANETMQVYSDRTLKNSISYDLDVEEKLFSLLRPCSFAYNSDSNGKKHWGFIAQDFIQSAEEVGLDAEKLAVVGEYEGKYSLGYGEITALNTLMIQKLMERMDALENAGGE